MFSKKLFLSRIRRSRGFLVLSNMLEFRSQICTSSIFRYGTIKLQFNGKETFCRRIDAPLTPCRAISHRNFGFCDKSGSCNFVFEKIRTCSIWQL